MNENIVKIDNLSHRYSKDWAVKEVNLSIKENGVIGLLGSNGAGKSTLMNNMCGTLDQTRGDVYINGIDLRKYPMEAKKHIGFLPQKAPLHPDLTVDEYLVHCACLRLMKKERIPEAIKKAKTKCGIMHFSERLLRNLSGGYQQRVGIAQAIVHNPQFVVLDEPTNGLDPNQIVEVRNLIKSISENRVVLISTHILSEVEAICDYIKMIENGVMVFEGTTREFHNIIDTKTILAIMKNPPPVSELENIEGITSVESLDDHGAFRFHFEKVKDITEHIIEKSVKNNWRLSEINTEKVPLDRVFAQLSKTEFINK